MTEQQIWIISLIEKKWVVHEPRRRESVDPSNRPTDDIEDALDLVRGRLGTEAGWRIVSMVPLAIDRNGGYVLVVEREFRLPPRY